MQGRILGIKKSTILWCSFIFAWLNIIVFSLLTILLYQNYFMWFFILCLFLGIHILIKSILFHLDSSFYFGLVLLFISIVGIVTIYTKYHLLDESLYLYAFALASLFTSIKYSQKYQVFLFFNLIFVATIILFFKLHLIPFPIFLALLIGFVLLFVVENMLFFIKRKRS